MTTFRKNGRTGRGLGKLFLGCKKLKVHTQKFPALADHLDQEHRDCALSNVVSGSTSTASGALESWV